MSDAATVLPPTASPLERALEQVEAARQALLAAANAGLWNPATCPERVLAWLAWAFAVKVWDPAWPEAKRRATIAASLEIHRRMGTRGALERALATADRPATPVEWFEEGRLPFTFRLDAAAEGATLAEILELQALALSAKNLRSRFDGVRLKGGDQTGVYLAAAARARLRISLPAEVS